MWDQLSKRHGERDVRSGEGHSAVGGGQPGSQAFRWAASGGMFGFGYLPGSQYESDAWDVSYDGTPIAGRSFSPAAGRKFIAPTRPHLLRVNFEVNNLKRSRFELLHWVHNPDLH